MLLVLHTKVGEVDLLVHNSPVIEDLLQHPSLEAVVSREPLDGSPLELLPVILPPTLLEHVAVGAPHIPDARGGPVPPADGPTARLFRWLSNRVLMDRWLSARARPPPGKARAIVEVPFFFNLSRPLLRSLQYKRNRMDKQAVSCCTNLIPSELFFPTMAGVGGGLYTGIDLGYVRAMADSGKLGTIYEMLYKFYYILLNGLNCTS